MVNWLEIIGAWLIGLYTIAVNIWRFTLSSTVLSYDIVAFLILFAIWLFQLFVYMSLYLI